MECIANTIHIETAGPRRGTKTHVFSGVAGRGLHCQGAKAVPEQHSSRGAMPDAWGAKAVGEREGDTAQQDAKRRRAKEACIATVPLSC